MGELVLLNIGHAGVRIAEDCWELFCREHGIDDSGMPLPDQPEQLPSHTIFAEMSNSKLVPRTIFVDTDSDPIDDLQRGKQRQLFNKRNIVAGKDPSSSNFIRGEYTIGK